MGAGGLLGCCLAKQALVQLPEDEQGSHSGRRRCQWSQAKYVLSLYLYSKHGCAGEHCFSCLQMFLVSTFLVSVSVSVNVNLQPRESLKSCDLWTPRSRHVCSGSYPKLTRLKLLKRPPERQEDDQSSALLSTSVPGCTLVISPRCSLHWGGGSVDFYKNPIKLAIASVGPGWRFSREHIVVL